MNIFQEIKWAWQRVVRGYDDRFGWGMDVYLESYFLPEIKRFCQESIQDSNYCELNREGERVFWEMLNLIEDFEKSENSDWMKEENTRAKMWSYFGKNIGWFWD